MPTTKEHVAQVLEESPLPLAPADIHAELLRLGVETSVGYVNQVLQRLKEEESVDQPREGRWGIAGRTYDTAGGPATGSPAIHAEPSSALPFEPGAPHGKPTPNTFFVLRGPDGRAVLYLEASLVVGAPIEMRGEAHPMGAPQGG